MVVSTDQPQVRISEKSHVYHSPVPAHQRNNKRSKADSNTGQAIATNTRSSTRVASSSPYRPEGQAYRIAAQGGSWWQAMWKSRLAKDVPHLGTCSHLCAVAACEEVLVCSLVSSAPMSQPTVKAWWRCWRRENSTQSVVSTHGLARLAP
eukprot:scaffold2360_cov380-Prasinococcus_capsulatus_cf.AAC.11